ncbi:MAG: hypothetical protein M3Y28_11420 [Armatimonadota bacterium]|nr:hypothetical protein [Armatimonadota bacterium]
MSQSDIQHILAMAIVAVAAWILAKRLWRQGLAFRSRPRRKPSTVKTPPAPPVSSPLIQLQIKPPVHLKRPPADDK